MAGFLDDSEINVIRGDEALAKRRASSPAKKKTCKDCGRAESSAHPKIQLAGQGRKGLLILGGFPTEQDDATGLHFSGDSGEYLRECLAEYNMNISKDCWKMYGVLCRGSGEAKLNNAIEACRPYLHAIIEKTKPKAILVLGRTAMSCLIGNRWTRRSGSRVDENAWAGYAIPDQELNCWVIPTYSLTQLASFADDKVLYRNFKNHVEKAVNHATLHTFRKYDYHSKCYITQEMDTAMKWLKEVKDEWKEYSFDYETTGLKPDRKEQEIKTVSFSNGLKAYAFPVFKDAQFQRLLCRTLCAPKERKNAHNAKFERKWTRDKLKVTPDGINADTMLNAHCLNNIGATPLKFLVYVYFGVLGYDDAVDYYLEAPTSEYERYGANGLNLIDQADMDEILRYNALDSLFSHMLLRAQSIEFDKLPHLRKGADFFTQASMALSDMERNGIYTDGQRIDAVKFEIANLIKEAYEKIQKSSEMKKWDVHKAFRPTADEDIKHLLFTLNGYKPVEFLPSGEPAMDYDSLSKLNAPIVEHIHTYKVWSKAESTYINNYIRESVDGYIHPNFNIHNVDTFRSSSADPNFQNIPKRDEDVKMMIRSLFRPRPGRRLIEYDYKSVEVNVGACYHKDPKMLEYILDPTTDMHRDTACDMFFRRHSDKELKLLGERQIAKNGFVFPSFYGDYYAQMAPKLWHMCGEETLAHLRGNGIRSLDDFTEHIKEMERILWYDRFPVYRQWREETLARYQKDGYVELYTGFRCYGPMKRNAVVNCAIQGTAFHVLLWTLMKVMKIMESEGMESLMVGQIHDAGIADVLPEEEARLDYLMWDYGTQKILKRNPWIIVPLAIEKSVSEIDGSWADMEEIGLLDFGG